MAIINKITTKDQNKNLFLLTLVKSEELNIWNILNDKLTFNKSIKLSKKPLTMEVPCGYENKVVIGYEDGTIELLNFKSTKLIFSFGVLAEAKKPLIIKSSSVKDVIGIGYENGEIIVLEIKKNIVLTRFNQNQHNKKGKITDMEFARLF